MTREQWLDKRCFAASDGEPVERLVEAKRAQALSVSVCIPALNVEGTVAPIVEAIRRAYVSRHRLVDELIVINGPSDDETATRARRAGAIVVDEHEVLPKVGDGAGKGEALWKSLAASSGDLVLWLDSDVHDFEPGVVPAMLAPLIEHPSIDFVKAHYRRTFGDEPSGGGRVTEICARPLLNLFFPELTVFAQPLAGEVAGRRALLEAIPFCSGYGVEIGMLIDVWRRAGIGAMAQVDLGSRRHDHQDVAALGEMAYTITQAVLRRVEEGGREAGTDRYLRAAGDGRGRVSLVESTVHLAERPPMVEMPGYPR